MPVRELPDYEVCVTISASIGKGRATVVHRAIDVVWSELVTGGTCILRAFTIERTRITLVILEVPGWRQAIDTVISRLNAECLEGARVNGLLAYEIKPRSRIDDDG